MHINRALGYDLEFNYGFNYGIKKQLLHTYLSLQTLSGGWQKLDLGEIIRALI